MFQRYRPAAAAETMCLLQFVHDVMRRQQKLSFCLKRQIATCVCSPRTKRTTSKGRKGKGWERDRCRKGREGLHIAVSGVDAPGRG